MSRTEKTFQAEIRKSLFNDLKSPLWYKKIPDAGFQNPFDAILVYKNIAYAMEYKMLKNSKTINLYSLFSNRSHEILNLQTFHHSGGKSFVLINCYKKKQWNYIILLDWPQVCYLFNECKGRIKIEKLQNYRIDRYNGYWDILSMIERDYDRGNRAWIDVSLNYNSKNIGFPISELPLNNVSKQTKTNNAGENE